MSTSERVKKNPRQTKLPIRMRPDFFMDMPLLKRGIASIEPLNDALTRFDLANWNRFGQSP